MNVCLPLVRLICPFLVLHPRFHTGYWVQHGWLDEWVTEAIRILRYRYALFYLSSDNTKDGESSGSETQRGNRDINKKKDSSPSSVRNFHSQHLFLCCIVAATYILCLLCVLQDVDSSDNDFDGIFGPSKTLTDALPYDEVTHYLNLGAEEECDDPIEWWWTHRKKYPNLSRMALDYLSIPGT